MIVFVCHRIEFSLVVGAYWVLLGQFGVAEAKVLADVVAVVHPAASTKGRRQ